MVAGNGTSSVLVTWLAALSPILAVVIGSYLAWRLRQVHTLVNSQMTNALARIVLLENKLGLQPGETIPGAAIVTQKGSASE